MSDLVQQSTLRGDFRRPLTSLQGLSTTDVHNQIAFDRPDPIKIGWTTFDVVQFGPATLPTTGYGPGSLYFVIPSAANVALGFQTVTQTWLLTATPQPGGVGNWVLVSSLATGSGSSGGGGDSGTGGGDGGEG